MPTQQTKKYRLRHDKWVLRQADRVITKMEIKGLALHMQHFWYGPCWFFSNGERLDAEIAEAVIEDPRIVGIGDSLFPGRIRGQTWRFTPLGRR
jgi:hypothetical protein